MEDEQVRALIRAKIADGRLPRAALTHVWGGSGDGRACAACDETIGKHQLQIEGEQETFVGPFHLRCFHLWDSERRDGDSVFRLPTNEGGA